ncbi:MAG: Uma2 family endonuclease [Jaaginema sp. PMC 1079.18]|nr:Uma2 family endonuclease [Jaaginema sp. PMC 1080.18]MEC4849939.1 Uma2 family endonuclease [Jaaginema sp. PMC 1079.18]MEC4865164.1 Uma2 family endonuclease [Jaaginema sp. PMC 1078.18]
MKTLAKWSVEDYHRMIAAGILRDRRVELLTGEIVEMSPETPLHYTTVKQGAAYLAALLVGKADVRFNGLITLSDSEPEPDLAIVRLPESSYFQRHPTPQDIFWVVEVAQTSLKHDREIKAGIYAAASIAEYWLIDLSAPQMLVFRNPQGGQYQEELKIREGIISPLAFPNLSISVPRLLFLN